MYGMPASMLGAEEAQLALEPQARLTRALAFQNSTSIEEAEHSANTALRAGDEFGHLTGPNGKASAARIAEWADMVMRINTATHGNVNGEALFGISQQAGAGVLKHMTDEGVYGVSAMAQVLGGHRTGTSLMALFNQFAGGKMTANTAQALVDNGILDKSEVRAAAVRIGDIIVDGRIIGWIDSSIGGPDTFTPDLDGYVPQGLAAGRGLGHHGDGDGGGHRAGGHHGGGGGHHDGARCIGEPTFSRDTKRKPGASACRIEHHRQRNRQLLQLAGRA
jgi:hypothetical protein